MNLKITHHPVIGEVLRRASLAAVRFALYEAGSLLRASAPLIVRAGEKLQALSEHESLKSPPPSSHV